MKGLNLYSIIAEKLYQELGLDSLRPGDGLGNFAYSTKYIRTNHLLICII